MKLAFEQPETTRDRERENFPNAPAKASSASEAVVIENDFHVFFRGFSRVYTKDSASRPSGRELQVDFTFGISFDSIKKNSNYFAEQREAPRAVIYYAETKEISKASDVFYISKRSRLADPSEREKPIIRGSRIRRRPEMDLIATLRRVTYPEKQLEERKLRVHQANVSARRQRLVKLIANT